MPIDTTRTGAAIAAYRQRMNLSQQGLAGLMNVTHQAVSKWEKGLALPDTETLLALAKLFGTSMEDLLMGKLPAEPEATVAEDHPSAPEEVPVQEAPVEEAAASIPAVELDDLDFSAVMNMLPFVSTKAADHLFLTYAKTAQLDASALLSIAPFVSTRTLADYVQSHSFKAESPEVLASLVPFLPTRLVDEMILSMEKPLTQHVVQMLIPFASTKVVDQMVLGKFGIPADDTPDDPSDISRQIMDKVHQKIRRKLDALDERSSIHPLSADAKKAAAPTDKRESPRMRLIRKAIENGQYEMIVNCFDELDDEARRTLLSELMETGDAQLLRLFCEAADELDPNAQAALVELLLKGRLYGELAEIIDELDEDVQHLLLDKAFEINDPELLHLISEHL